MDFAKLYRPTRFNSWQFIAFVGLLMSGGAELLISYVVRRPLPPGYGWLYVCWAALFVGGRAPQCVRQAYPSRPPPLSNE